MAEEIEALSEEQLADALADQQMNAELAAEAESANEMQSTMIYKIQSDLAARVIRRLERERSSEERLKKKIMKDMLSTVHGDTTQFILDKTEEALVKVREFIEQFFKYKGPSGLAELWMKVQQLLDMLEPFTQLPGVVVPGVGDIGQMANDFIMMQKIIYDAIPAEERQKIKKQVEEEKKSKKKPTLAQKIGKEIEEQADQTWEAVQILIEEWPRIKEDLYMMCLENSWGLIMKICKMLGIPIDVFPFNLLAEVPEIEKLIRDLRRNGKKMLKEAFGEMMLPLYIYRTMFDSIPTTDQLKLSAVCIELVDNKYQTEYQRAVKKVADLYLRKKRYEDQRENLKEKVKQVENRISLYKNSTFAFQNTFNSVKKEAEKQISAITESVDLLKKKIPQEEQARDDAETAKNNKAKIKEQAHIDFEKACKLVTEKNKEIAVAIKKYEEQKEKRRQFIMELQKSDEKSKVAGVDDATNGGEPDAAVLEPDYSAQPLRGVNSRTEADMALEAAIGGEGAGTE